MIHVSFGISFGTLITGAKPEPMSNFDFDKVYGEWYSKMVQSPNGIVSCQRVKASYISKIKHGAQISRVLKGGKEQNVTLVLRKETPGVYKTMYQNKGPMTLTVVDTDYDNYIVYVITDSHGDLQLVSIDGRSRYTRLGDPTVQKVLRMLDAQKVDHSTLKSTDRTVPC